ncbi:MAG: cupin domain-containing protein, partial [Clostridia bacterium]|nr:cupin domain-containing protein [Clostridia bacterium]
MKNEEFLGIIKLRGDNMLYQKLHLGETPYILGYNPEPSFPEHKHPEIELFFCTKGSYDLTINKKKYTVNEGDLAIIGSMLSHEFYGSTDTSASSFFIEIGPAMLGN